MKIQPLKRVRRFGEERNAAAAAKAAAAAARAKKYLNEGKIVSKRAENGHERIDRVMRRSVLVSAAPSAEIGRNISVKFKYRRAFQCLLSYFYFLASSQRCNIYIYIYFLKKVSFEMK